VYVNLTSSKLTYHAFVNVLCVLDKVDLLVEFRFDLCTSVPMLCLSVDLNVTALCRGVKYAESHW